MSKIKALFLIILLISLSACATTSPAVNQATPLYSGEEYYQRGVEYYQNGLYDLSYTNFLAADNANYQKEASGLGASAALIAQNKSTEAISLLNNLVQVNPNNAQIWYNLGLAYYIENKITESVSALRNASRLEPNNPEIWNALGTSYLQKKEYSVAAEQFSKSISLDPNNLVAIHNRAIAYIESKMYQDAENDLDKMLELSRGTDKNALSGLAQVAYANKDYLAALDLLNQALSLDSSDGLAFYNRALVNQELGSYEVALTDLNKALAYEQNFVEAYIARGDLYFLIRNFEAGCADLKTACKLGDCMRLESAKAAGQCFNQL